MFIQLIFWDVDTIQKYPFFLVEGVGTCQGQLATFSQLFRELRQLADAGHTTYPCPTAQGGVEDVEGKPHLIHISSMFFFAF